MWEHAGRQAGRSWTVTQGVAAALTRYSPVHLHCQSAAAPSQAAGKWGAGRSPRVTTEQASRCTGGGACWLPPFFLQGPFLALAVTRELCRPRGVKQRPELITSPAAAGAPARPRLRPSSCRLILSVIPRWKTEELEWRTQRATTCRCLGSFPGLSTPHFFCSLQMEEEFSRVLTFINPDALQTYSSAGRPIAAPGAPAALAQHPSAAAAAAAACRCPAALAAATAAAAAAAGPADVAVVPLPVLGAGEAAARPGTAQSPRRPPP